MALVTTPGATNADSYVSLSEAAAYFDARFGSSAFSELGDPDREKALRQATREIDRYRFVGIKNYWSQALQFPRQYPYNSDNPEAGTGVEIPTSVRHAACEQALWIAQNAARGGRSSRQQLQDEGVVQSRVGSVAETFDGTRLGPLCPDARHLLERWINPWGLMATDPSDLFPRERLHN